MADTNNDIREITESGLADASGLINRREYNLSIVKSRMTAESVIKSYAAEKNIEFTTLADTIEKLFEEGIINRTSRDAFHNIRMYGNKAVREGDNDAEDAQKAFYLLKNEVGTFMSRKTVSVDRTPVKIDTKHISGAPAKNLDVEIAEESERRRPRRSEADDDFDVDTDSLKRRSGGKKRPDSASGRKSSGGRSGKGGKSGKGGRSGKGGKSGKRKSSMGGSFSIYDILHYLIPVIVVILLIIIVRSLLPAKKPAETTTPAPIETVIEETTIQETLPPQTEPETEPPVFEYRIKGEGVNVRYADNQNRIYTQLSNGTAIGTVEPIDGSDFVSFTLDGIKVIVKKDFIEPIQ